MDFWTEMAARGPATAVVGGVEVGVGARVRLRPRHRADVLDLALDGRIAVVESVEHDDAGEPLLAVTLEDDPGRDLGEARLPGHRFFFSPAEVEPVGDAPGGDTDAPEGGAGVPGGDTDAPGGDADAPGGDAPPAAPRVLVAGVGNVFLGDDGFGVEVVRELARRPWPPGVDVVDFGIRGMDLLYALQRGYDVVVFVDAAPRGEPPGTVSVIEADPPPEGGAAMETHGMDPVAVLRAARETASGDGRGPLPARALVVACEPGAVPDPTSADVVVGLSDEVRAAVPEAARLVESLVAGLRDHGHESVAWIEKTGGDEE